MARVFAVFCLALVATNALPVVHNGDELVELHRVKRGGAAAPAGGASYGSAGYSGYGYGPAAGAYVGSGSGGYGGINNAAAAAQAASEVGSATQVASAAAAAAVANVVRSDYNGQLATTAQFVSQYTAPVTSNEVHNAFHAVQTQQAAGQISAALAANAPTIWSAANSAANTNFAQAYQVAQAGSLAANAQNAYAQSAVQLAASAQAAQAQAAAQAAATASAAKTSHVAVDAAALAAVSGITATGTSAASNYGHGLGHYY